MVLPYELNNNNFTLFLKERKIIDEKIEWESIGKRMQMKSVPILNNIFEEKPPILNGWVHRFAYAFVITHVGKFNIIKFDLDPHYPGYLDPCKKNPIDEPHKHLFDENCPNWEFRVIVPQNRISRNDVNKALKDFLNYFNITVKGKIEKVILPPMDGKLTHWGIEL